MDNTQDELERRKKLHEAEQGLSTRQIAGLVVLHGYLSNSTKMSPSEYITTTLQTTDIFLRASS